MMFRTTLALALVLASASAFLPGTGLAQDWSQWRGENRDARALGFKAPKTWPKELTQKWRVSVGEGVASPAVVGGKVYVFSRQDGNEVIRCLNATDGKEVWADRYESLGATGAAQSHSGPRSSPTVAGGKVVTLGVRGMLSSLDAATGQKLWRKDEFKAYPNFHPSSSPLIADGLVIAQLGGRDNGAIVGYDVTSGEQKWKWSGPGPSYASPVLVKVGGSRLVVAHTESKLVAVNAADGTLAWEMGSADVVGRGGAGAPAGGGPGGGQGGQGGQGGEGGGRGRGGGGGGRDYKASTPAVDGQTVIIAGRGIKAVKFAQTDGKIVGTEVWNNADKSVQFASPTLKDGLIYGLTGNNEIFCLNAKDGSVAWSAPFPGVAAGGGVPGGPGAGPRPGAARSVGSQTVFGQAAPAAPGEGDRSRRPGGPGGPGGGRRGGGGGSGFGSIVDAGAVLFALTPAAQLIAFEPSAKELKVVATYKVAEGAAYAYPVVSGNRIFIKDKESLTLWNVESEP